MRPRTDIEKEVVRLSRRLPPLGKRMEARFIYQSSFCDATMFRRRMTDIQHFVVVTTSHGWQVLRHWYMYAVYRYDRKTKTYDFSEAEFLECMQEWFNGGKYVFLSLNRQQGYRNDAWCAGQQMTVKRGRMGGYVLRDPREIGYDKAFYVRATEQFRYLPTDEESDIDIGAMFRHVNANPFWETVIHRSPAIFNWCMKNNYMDGNRYKAVRTAWKRGYDFCNTEWNDLVDMHQYLGNDITNPRFVCPEDLKAEHDRVAAIAERKRERLYNERRRRWDAERRQHEQEDLERQKRLVEEYPKARGMFFGIVIAENDIEISVLKSVDDFMEEGKALEHCVYANSYYDIERKPYCLILSAKVNGERTETIEVDLKDYHIVQCRGFRNDNTPYHDEIVRIMTENMDVIRNINQMRVA